MSEKKELSPPAQVYENNMKAIEDLLKSITDGLKKHRASSEKTGIDFGSSGDLAHFRRDLQLISDHLQLEGEYAPEPKTEFRVFEEALRSLFEEFSKSIGVIYAVEKIKIYLENKSQDKR